MNARHLLFAFCALLNFQLIAQPTIEGTSPAIGDAFDLGVIEMAPDPGEAGENITWDFSSLDQGSLFEYEVLNLEDTPGNELFPNANFTTSVENAELEIPLYFYYEFDDVQWAEWGSYIADVDFPVAVVMDDSQIVHDFPITYGSTGSDTYSGEVQGFFNYAFTGNTEYTVDGYGSLILPDDSYSNVLRLEINRTQEDEPIGGLVSSSVSTVYAWINQEIPYPLLIIDETENFFNGQSEGIELSTTYMINYEEIATRTKDLQDAFAVLPFPNPSSGIFQFKLKSNHHLERIVVFDILGQEVDLSSGSYSEQRIDLSTHTPGIYLLQFEFTNGMSSSARVQILE